MAGGVSGSAVLVANPAKTPLLHDLLAERKHVEHLRAEEERLRQEREDAMTALEALLEHSERIQEHVPKSEHWYAVRDCARVVLRG
jgi:hypothetical protein